MSETGFLGLTPFRWMAVVVVVLTPLLLTDALTGHYRTGFQVRAQYAPFISGGLLTLAALAALLAPGQGWARIACIVIGILGIASGLIGFVFHQVYGTARKPGGYRMTLHYAMYGAPTLAPLVLAALGMLAVLAALGMGGASRLAGLSLRQVAFALAAVSLLGSVLQAAILHYRGAYNNPLMYVPVSLPLVTVVLLAVAACGYSASVALGASLWMSFLIGFIGLGMHLRGLDRQMGGLHVPLFNTLQGPPIWAPALFSAFAAVGLAALYLLPG